MSVARIPVDEDERLRALHDLDVLDTPPEERFDRVTRLCQRLFGVSTALVNLVDRDRLFMKSAQGIERGVMPRADAFCSHAILERDGIVVDDLEQDPRFADSPFVVGDPRYRFYAGIPLEAPGGQRVGTLCIADATPRVLTDGDRALLRDLATWVQKELNVEEELDRAAQVQRAMFPTRPLDAPGWDVAGACLPSREVGGDFYDWHRTPTGPVVTLGDVMGKGMPAAIVMATVRAALRSGARMSNLAHGVEDAAWSLADDLEATGTFASAVLARLSAAGAVTLVDAGHGHAAIVRRDGRVEPQTEGGLPLGISASEQYRSFRIALETGDLLLLHSDGLIELPGGPATTAQAAALIAGSTSAAQAVQRLLGVCDGHALPDDVTVVAVVRTA